MGQNIFFTFFQLWEFLFAKKHIIFSKITENFTFLNFLGIRASRHEKFWKWKNFFTHVVDAYVPRYRLSTFVIHSLYVLKSMFKNGECQENSPFWYSPFYVCTRVKKSHLRLYLKIQFALFFCSILNFRKFWLS